MIPVNIEHIRLFIKFAAKELKLPTLPQIKLVGSSENRFDAFGHSTGALIVVRITDRHPIDIMRTIGHELIHYKQNVLKIRASENFKEDQANLMAGRIMRDFDTAFPAAFKDKAIRANMLHCHGLKEDVGCGPLEAAPANMTGQAIAGYDPLMQIKDHKKKRSKALRDAIKNQS
jgi:hypothetical protein